MLRKVSNYVNVINLYMQGLDNFELFDIRFDKAITGSYIKIISNIYHINLTKSIAQYFKKEQELKDTLTKAKDKNRDAIFALRNQFNNIYKANLDKTREEVSKHYNLENHKILEIPIKILLRIYPMYLPKSHSVRQKYSILTETVNKLIERIELFENFPELTDSKHSNYCLVPLNVEYDFEAIINPNGNIPTFKSEANKLMANYKEKYEQKDEDEEVN